MAYKKERDLEKHNEWQKEHTVRVTMRLQRTTDADLVDALENSGERPATFIKRMAKLGLERSKELGSETDTVN